jgi:hypothetical protein
MSPLLIFIIIFIVIYVVSLFVGDVPPDVFYNALAVIVLVICPLLFVAIAVDP